MELKKTYWGFVLWVLAFFVLALGAAFLPIEDAALLTRICNNFYTVALAVLTGIIYRTGYIYWYSGMTGIVS